MRVCQEPLGLEKTVISVKVSVAMPWEEVGTSQMGSAPKPVCITSRPSYPGCPKPLGPPGGLQSQCFLSFSPSLGLAGLVAVRSCEIMYPRPLCHLLLNPRSARLWRSELPASYGPQALQSTGMGWGQEKHHHHLCIHSCPGQALRCCPSFYPAPDGVEQ